MRHKQKPMSGPAVAGTGAPQNRRKHSRKPSDGAGTLFHRPAEKSCELVNLSYGGACVTCPKGFVPNVGQPVQLQFPDGSTAIGRVAWVSKQEIGITFLELVPDVFDRPDSASDGLRSFTRIVSLQISKHSG
jgi:PilZ domain